MGDRAVLMARDMAEVTGGLIALGLWFSLDEPLRLGAVVGMVVFWFLLRSILISVAALLFR